jgi:hypothetical protein
MWQQFKGKVEFLDSNGNAVLNIDPDASASSGAVQLYNDTGKETIILYSSVEGGLVIVKNGIGQETLRLDGLAGMMFVGGANQGGIVMLRDGAAKNTIILDGRTADLLLSGGNQDGTVVLRNGAGQNTVHLDGSAADLFLGGPKQPGTVVLRNSEQQDTIRLEGGTADLFLGGGNQGGTVVLRDAAGQNTLLLDGTSSSFLTLGGAGRGGTICLKNGAGQNTMVLDGVTGDINLLNADCAEDFDISDVDEVEPGTVMVLDREGKLQRGREAYDKKVAGVISGAGDYKPGIVLDKKQSEHHRLPVALMGKVYCKVDAQYSRIEVDDLLTTSPTAGHAMKATDPLKSLGAIIGKALRPLPEGQGMIPVLIALQ